MRPSEVIATVDTWTKGWVARDKKDEICDANNKSACRWCAQGAIDRAIGFDDLRIRSEDNSRFRRIADNVVKALYPPFDDLVEFNDDDRTHHEQVLKVLREAEIQFYVRPA